MSQESRVKSHESKAAELASGFRYINYRTIDFDDAFGLALGKTQEVLDELVAVNVTDQLKEQAAFCVGQYFLDELAVVETKKIADDLSGVVSALGRPLIVMVSIPEGANG